jgi:hypothetical protein
MTKAFILAVLDFGKLFNVNYDASGPGIKGVLSQDRRPITFFRKTL